MSTNSFAFGAYWPVDSRIHRIDPRIKIIITILLMILIFTTTSSWIYLFIGVLLSVICYFGKIISICLKRIRSILLLLIVMPGISMILTAGRPLFPSLSFLSFSYEGMIIGIHLSVRLIFTLMITSILTLTTTPFLMMRAIETMLKPLKKVGVPISEIAMIIQLTFRFIPTFMQEQNRIIKAQSARGYTVETKRFIEKSKGMLALVVPLLSLAFRRVDELANAMDARGYVVGIKRSNIHQMKFSTVDYCLLIVVVVVVIIGLVKLH